MKLEADSGFTSSRPFLAVGLILCLTVCGRAQARCPVTSLGSNLAGAAARGAASGDPVPVARGDHFQIKRYIMNFAGDHSLEFATVIEQAVTGYAKYTVQLHLASGIEQSVILAAPPGGLQPEMHDMTGDHTPNDVVLRPALARWPPTVLVNDGHDHYTVAITGRDPESFSSNEDLGSQRRYSQSFAMLMSSGFKSVYIPNNRRLFDPQLQQYLFSSFTQTVTNRLCHAASPGRAPPLVIAI